MAKVRFLAHGRSWEVEVPAGSSILEASKKVSAPEGDACGGVCACSTCHVYVTRGKDLLSEAEEEEDGGRGRAGRGAGVGLQDGEVVGELRGRGDAVADGRVVVGLERAADVLSDAIKERVRIWSRGGSEVKTTRTLLLDTVGI